MTAGPGATSHEALIIAIAEHRDRQAFTALFAHFAPRVKAYLLRTGLSAPAAEDMAQEVLLTVWHKAGQFNPAIAHANAWIFTIARNLRIDVARHERLILPAADPSEEPAPAPLSDALVAAEQSAQAIRNAIQTLPTEQMTVLQLAFYDDRSHSEIEHILGLPLGTIKSRLRLAISKLRLAMRDLS